MPGPGGVPLFRGRVIFSCPACSSKLGLSKKETGHEVTSTSDGKATVSPAWACRECYLVGKVKDGKVIPVGRAGDHQIPIGTTVAQTDPPSRVAVIITSEKDPDEPGRVPLSELFEDLSDEERWKHCPSKRKHGWYTSQGTDECPLCEKPLQESATAEEVEKAVESVSGEGASGDLFREEEDPEDLDWENDYRDAQAKCRQLRETGDLDEDFSINQNHEVLLEAIADVL